MACDFILVLILLLRHGIQIIVAAGQDQFLLIPGTGNIATVVGALDEIESTGLDDCPSDADGAATATSHSGPRTCSRKKRHDDDDEDEKKKAQTKIEERLLFDGFKPADPSDFIELQGDNSIYHQLRPDGFAYFPREKMLTYLPKDPNQAYPPFSYHGLYGPKIWHQIPWQDFLKLKNKSFMLLKHKCEAIAGGGSAGVDLTEMVSCQQEEFPKLPRCDSSFQSPINIIRGRARESVLLSDYAFRNFNQKFQFLMSLPWDGTSLLTVEILNAQKSPTSSLSAYSNPSNFNHSSGSGFSFRPTATNASAGASGSGRSGVARSPQIALGPLTGGELYLDRIHIKYGTSLEEGSEHKMDGRSYAMELQFIFTKEGRQSLTQYWDALMKYYTSDGTSGEKAESLHGKHIHIISVFVNVVHEIDPEDKWLLAAAEEFKKLSAVAKHFWSVHNRPVNDSQLPAPFNEIPLRHRGFKSANENASITLSHLIPPKQVVDGRTRSSPYYTYMGSLTHPPCFEYVHFGVYEKPIQITREMWKSFHFIPSDFDDTRFLAGNFRRVSDVYNLATDLSVQKDREKVDASMNLINSRTVRKSVPKFDDESLSDSDIYDYFGDNRATDSRCGKILLVVLLMFLARL